MEIRGIVNFDELETSLISMNWKFDESWFDRFSLHQFSKVRKSITISFIQKYFFPEIYGRNNLKTLTIQCWATSLTQKDIFFIWKAFFLNMFDWLWCCMCEFLWSQKIRFVSLNFIPILLLFIYMDGFFPEKKLLAWIRKSLKKNQPLVG